MNINVSKNRLDSLKTKNSKSVVLYISAGDPDIQETLKIMIALDEGGADCIELGIPFSDPMADGPIIQEAGQRALKNNITLNDIFKLVKDFRIKSNLPLVLMGYYNSILRFGEKRFADEAVIAGVDGVIIADLPFEEGEKTESIFKKSGLKLIYLLAPKIDPVRTKKILNASNGFVYLVSQYATTGKSGTSSDTLELSVSSLKKETDLPIMIGFGISSISDVKKYIEYADGVIIGSWLIKELEKSKNKSETAAMFIQNIKNSLK